MKKLSSKAIKGILLTSGVVTASVCVLAMNNKDAFEVSNKETLNLAETEKVETNEVETLAEVEDIVKEAEAKVEAANIAVQQAVEAEETAKEEVATAEAAVKEAEETQKIAEEEVKQAKTAEEKKAAEEKVEAAKAKVEKAKEEKNTAEAKAKETEENRKAAEATAEQAETERKTAVETQAKEAEENKKNAEVTAEKGEEESQNINETKGSKEEKSSETNKSTTTETSETKSKEENTNSNEVAGRTLTDEQLKYMLEQAAKGEEADRKKYIDDYTEKYGHAPEEEKHEVEFHFYSTLRTLTIRRPESKDDEDYWSKSICGEDGSGCIWFAEFSCDLNECVGFNKSGSLVSKALIGLRGDITEYTMEAPAAKPGYRFKQWEITSAYKDLGGEYGNVLVNRYRAIYEKY